MSWATKYGWIYRNYFPSKGCFYDWKENKGLYDEISAREWYKEVSEFMTTIEIVRPPKNIVNITLPIKEKWLDVIEEDKEFAQWLATAKIEPRMWYVIDQILDDYYFGKDNCFHLREKKIVKESPDYGVIFTMREVIDWIIRTSPIQVRTFTEKDTQKVNFTNWDLGSDVQWVKFTHHGRQFETNFFWLYGPKFREAIFPNSNFNWHRLMAWQRQSFLERGKVTIIKAPRSWGKCTVFWSDIRMFDWTFKKVENIVVWDKLLSSNRKWYVTVIDTEVSKKEANKITLMNWMEKNISFDHRIPTEINYSRDWWDLDIDNYKNASDLSIWDHLATNIWFKWKWWTYREWLLVWSFIWDWWNNTQQIACSNPLFAEYLLSYTKWTYLNWKTIQIHKSEFNKDKYVCNWISYNKYIDNKYFWYSEEFKRGLICWLIATDWYITKHSSKWYIMWYCSTSKKLCEWLQTILADLWIFSTLNLKKFKSQFKSNTGNIAYTVSIANNYDMEKIIKNVNLSYKKNYKWLVNSLWASLRNSNQNNIPLCAFKECEVKSSFKWTNKKRRYYWESQTREPWYNFNRNKCSDYWLEHWLDYSWVQVKSNESIWLKDVMHISVDWDHTYYDWNILTHNSLSTTAFVATFLFKELNMPHEYDRPFLIIYGWLSKEANLQVVEYLRAMAKKITTNKNILNWNKWDQILTLYDGFNERKIKFVSQGQEWQGFRWLRPHLVVLDEASRLSKEMYDVAAGTVEAPMIIISTTNKDDKKNWFEDMYKQGLVAQRHYIPVEDLIKETWIKFGMDKIKTREELQWAINKWVIRDMRQYFYMNRPLVSLKYTIYDVEYLTADEQQEQIDKYMASWEDVCLAELFNELSDSRTIFNTDWLIESNVPDTFDHISCAFDEAEEYDNPAFVCIGYKGKIAYVIHSEILDKTDHIKKYARIAEILTIMRRKTTQLTWAADMTRVQRIWLRELTNFVSEPDFPILYTSAKNWDVNRKRPFYLVPKEKMIQIAQDEFFKKSKIIFSNDLDIDGWLIEEIANFKRNNKWAAAWQKKQPDDQVNGMIMSLFGLYRWHIRNNIQTETVRWDITIDERYDKVLMGRINNVDETEYKNKMSRIVNNFR